MLFAACHALVRPNITGWSKPVLNLVALPFLGQQLWRSVDERPPEATASAIIRQTGSPPPPLCYH